MPRQPSTEPEAPLEPKQPGSVGQQQHQVEPAVAASAATPDSEAAAVLLAFFTRQQSLQLYGKSITFCAALVMFVVSLGNANDEDEGVVWLVAPKPNGMGIGAVSNLQLADLAGLNSADSASSSSHNAALQVETRAEATTELHSEAELESTGQNSSKHSHKDDNDSDGSDDDDDDDNTDADDEDEEGQSDASAEEEPAELPNVDRCYAVPLLPVSRQELQTPALLLGVPSHGLPGLVAYVFEPAASSGTGCAVVAQAQDMQVTVFTASLKIHAWTSNGVGCAVVSECKLSCSNACLNTVEAAVFFSAGADTDMLHFLLLVCCLSCKSMNQLSSTAQVR